MWRVLGMFLLGIWSFSALSISAQTVTGINISVDGAQTRVKIDGIGAKSGSDLPQPNIFVLDGTSPRIVADFKGTKADLHGKAVSGAQNEIQGEGHISKIRYAARGTSGLRIVFDLKPNTRLLNTSLVSLKTGFIVQGRDLTPEVVTVQPSEARQFASQTARKNTGKNLGKNSGKTIGKPQACRTPPCPRLAPHVLKAVSQTQSIQPKLIKPVKVIQPASSLRPRYFESRVPYPQVKPRVTIQIAKAKRRPVIVIDPGHGGRDPGAIGTRKTREKDITYKASLQLRAELLKSGRYEVILTRDDDRYIEHAERLRIARAGGADLFISVHADSTSSKSARGASVYTLADRAKKRSKKIVSTQNWIMDVDLQKQSNSVGDILVDLAQRKTATQSDHFADILLRELKSTTRLIGNSHRKAGYFVLLAPDVPAVLLELGFLSNPQDEKLLNSTAHRTKIIKSVRKAIDQYFDEEKL